MTASSPLQPRKQPRQARSAATVAALVEACGQVLERQGLAGLTTNRVAERAGASIGSLYQYVPAKEALLQALADRERARLLEELVSLAAPWAWPPSHAWSRTPDQAADQAADGAPDQSSDHAPLETARSNPAFPQAQPDPLWACLDAMVAAGLRHQFSRPAMAQALEAQDSTPASQAATAAFDHTVSALLGLQLAAWAQRQGRRAPAPPLMSPPPSSPEHAASPASDPSDPSDPPDLPAWRAVGLGLLAMARALIHSAAASSPLDAPLDAPLDTPLDAPALARHQQAIVQAAMAYLHHLAPGRTADDPTPRLQACAKP